MKKFLSVLLAVMMLLSALPVMAEEIAITETVEEAIVAPVVLEPEEEEEKEEEPAHECTDGKVECEPAEGVHFSCATGKVETVKPTCTEKGYDVYKCHEEACGKTFTTNYVDATGHDFVMNADTGKPAAKVTKEATCTEAGTIEYTCKVCGTVTEEIPALDHTWGEVTEVKVTCTTDGYKEHTCTKCGAYEKFDVEKKLEHLADDELYYDCLGAICDAKGKLVEFFICQRPGCLEKVIVSEVSEYWAEMDHQAELDALVKVELTAEMTEAEKAAIIRNMAKDVVAKAYVAADGNLYINVAPEGKQIPGAPEGCLGWFHDALVDYEPATCTEDGHLVLTCVSDKCATKANVSVVLPKLGHDYVTDEEKLGKENQPTCMENGAVLVHCSRCDFEEQVEIVAPGFHEMKKSTYTQTTLNGTKKDVALTEIALCADYTETKHCVGHEKVVIKLSNGDKINYKIKNCKHTETVEHVADETKHVEDPASFAVQQPTCTEYGFKMSYCTACGETIKVVLKPLNHEIDGVSQRETKIVDDPTCTKDGEKHEICKLCGDVKKVAIPATKHAWDNIEESVVNSCPVKVVEKTCTTDGSITTTCIFCGEKKVETIPASHEAPTDEEIKNGEGNQAYLAPTCTKDGERSYRCTVCHEYIVGEKIPALGHEWERDVNNDGVVDSKDYSNKYECKENGQFYAEYQEATCKQDGIYKRTCSVCGHKDSYKVSDKIGCLLCAYDEVKGEVVTNNLIIDTKNLPTCEATGKAYFNCVICGKYNELVLPKLPHNPDVKFNKEERVYEIVCADATVEEAKALMVDYLWDEIMACTDVRSEVARERAKTVWTEAMGDLFVKLADSEGNCRGIGGDHFLEKITVNKTEYNVAMEGNTVTIKAKDNVALLENAYVLVSWAYELSDGSSFTFSNVYYGKANADLTEWTFKVRAGSLQNATLLTTTVVVTDNDEAESVRAEKAKEYGILTANH